jgi:hypothetical protein
LQRNIKKLSKVNTSFVLSGERREHADDDGEDEEKKRLKI